MTKSTTYTVAVREKGRRTSHWLYVHSDLKVRDTATGCKPLSREEAQTVKQLFLDGAAKAGRPIECRIVRLCQ